MRWPIERVARVFDRRHWNLGLVHFLWSGRWHSLYVMFLPGCWGVRIQFKRKEDV